MTYKEAIKFIDTRSAFSTKESLEQITLLLEALGNPHKNLKYIHVGGTNGKGSVCKMCSEILKNSGYTVGLFVSPSLVSFCERFQINNEMISEDKFVQIAQRVITCVDELKWRGFEITQFEIITAIGLLYFFESGCDVVCLEVGMGGKLDSTNVIPRPLAALITAIDFDHTAFLGDSIDAIAYEKSGIIKRDTDVIVYPFMNQDALDMIKEKCKFTYAKLHITDVSTLKVEGMTALSTKFSYEGVSYKLGLVGEHQAYNTVMVIETMKILSKKGFIISDEIIKRTLKAIRFNARFQVIYLEKYRTTFSHIIKKPSVEPITILDGSHNPHSFAGLAKTLQATDLDKKPARVLVIGMLKDKDVEASLSNIIPLFTKMIAVPADDSSRSMKPEKLAEKAKGKCGEIYIEDSIQAGVEKAYDLAKDNGLIVIAGSLHLSSKILELYTEN